MTIRCAVLNVVMSYAPRLIPARRTAHLKTSCIKPSIHPAPVVLMSANVVFQLPDQLGLLDDGFFDQITNR
jgi:hypothetical protein